MPYILIDKIILEGCKDKSQKLLSEEYHAKEMSDGKSNNLSIRSTLIAPNDMTIIIDEPEIHLHKSIKCIVYGIKLKQFLSKQTHSYI